MAHLKGRYREKWRDPAYSQRSPAFDSRADLLTELLALAPLSPETPVSVVDVGTGTGRILPVLHEAGYRVIGADPHTALACDDELYRVPAIKLSAYALGEEIPDWLQSTIALCIDTLEHIPAELLDCSLAALAYLGRKGALLGISLLPDQGQLHCSVYPKEFWLEKTKCFWGTVAECPVTVNLPRQNADNWLLLRCSHAVS